MVGGGGRERQGGQEAKWYMVGLVRQVEHPMMRWVAKATERCVQVGETVEPRAIIRALEKKGGVGAGREERAEKMEQINMAMPSVERQADPRGKSPSWITRPGVGREARKAAKDLAQR